jgi:N-glycosylase/DNA lyase
MKKQLSKLSAEELTTLFESKREPIRLRLDEFSRVPDSEYFYELMYCLLTPQSSAVNAAKAVRLLRAHDLQHAAVNPEPLLHQHDFYIRFHKTKAKHIIAAKEQFPVIAEHLAGRTSPAALRDWLVANVTGLGWKEASHFLRNIGHRNLAILDRHILRNLIRAGVIRRFPATLTAKRYLSIEKKFVTFSQRIGISMDELDLLFWSMETGEILK